MGMKYKCKACGEVFAAKWDVVCPKCGGTETETVYEFNYSKQVPAESNE
jgi:rRNA maturation endonuclease Nob1